MRNLLSFVLGVISRLLYLLLRLILLLDRTICRVYDLPVWSRFAGVLRQAGRRRSVCALSVFGLLFLLPALLLTRPGTLLLADGQPLGVIEDSATLLNAVNAVESSASAVSGTELLPAAAPAGQTGADSRSLLTQEELERNLITASGELDTLAIISVDGRADRHCRRHGRRAGRARPDQGRSTRQRQTKTYTSCRTVRVDKAVAPAALAESDLGALYSIPCRTCLDVTATRAVTYTEQIPYRHRSRRRTTSSTRPTAQTVTAGLRGYERSRHRRDRNRGR